MTFKLKVKAFFAKLKNIVIPVLAYGGLAGILVGLVVSLFNFTASLITRSSNAIYDWFAANPAFIPLLFLCLIVLALFTSLLHKYVPQVRGSGIPQTEGVMRGLVVFKWFKILVSTVVGSFISFFAGLPLGAEGPSVQIGATTAQGACEMTRARPAWRRYVVTGGASAGLAVAFNAPLTGIIFALEEGHRRFTPMILLTASSSVIFATVTYRTLSSLWGAGEKFLFDMGQISVIPTKAVWMLLILGIVCGAAAVLFNWALISSQKLLDKHQKKVPYWARLVCVFVLTGAIGLIPILKNANGGGHNLIMAVSEMDFAWQVLMLLLIVKFVMIVLCYDSGATGGLFIPMLSLGALIGGLCGKLFIAWGLDPLYYKAIVSVSMATFFGASVRAPITAIVLIVEVTGYMSGFLSNAVAIISAFLVAELLGNRPIYDSMLERYCAIENKGQQVRRVTLEVEVGFGAFLINKCVHDVLWPANCLVLNIVRGDKELVPDGETRIEAGDVLVINAETADSKETYNYIKGLI